MPVVSVTAPAQDARYDIHIGRGLLGRCAPLLAPYAGRRAAVVADSNTAPLYADALMAQITLAGAKPALITLPAGEASKSPQQLSEIYDAFLDMRLTRSDVVLALGGGVVGDIAGYAACTYMRGTRFVQVPTTLLSQVDSAVGGKVAVNHPRGKNLLGAFCQPEMVIIDCDTLGTLDERQIGAGLGEAIKYGLIADSTLFDLFEQAGSRGALMPRIEQVIARCCALKAEYVRQDPHDHGVRFQLNFGHTLGHALENTMGYGRLLHGEGVAIGMAAAAGWGEKLGVTPQGTAQRIRALLARYGLMTDIPDGMDRDAIAAAMSRDKKADGAAIRTVLLTGIGACTGMMLTPAQLRDLL